MTSSRQASQKIVITQRYDPMNTSVITEISDCNWRDMLSRQYNSWNTVTKTSGVCVLLNTSHQWKSVVET